VIVNREARRRCLVTWVNKVHAYPLEQDWDNLDFDSFVASATEYLVGEDPFVPTAERTFLRELLQSRLVHVEPASLLAQLWQRVLAHMGTSSPADDEAERAEFAHGLRQVIATALSLGAPPFDG
jgi:hypothetical protein